MSGFKFLTHQANFIIYKRKIFLRGYQGVVYVILLAGAIAANNVQHRAKDGPFVVDKNALNSLEVQRTIAILKANHIRVTRHQHRGKSQIGF